MIPSHRIFTLFFVAFLSIALWGTGTPADGAANAKWLTGYRYRVPVTMENKADVPLPETPALLRFDTMEQILIGRMRQDGNDLRVADANGNELPRYIEGLHDDSVPARIWIKSTPLGAGVKQILYIYYGNPTATAPADAGSMIFSGAPQPADDAVLSEDFEKFAPEPTPVAGTPRITAQGVLGYHGKGGWFNGQNAGLTLKVPEPAALNHGFTVSLWMKMLPHKIVAPSALVDIDGVFLIRENEAILATPQSRPVVPFKTPINEWMHVAATYDGSALRVFVNGKEAGSKEVKGTPAFTRGQVALGFDPGNGFYSPVVMDDFAIWTRVLTSFPDAHAFPVATIGKEEINTAVPEPADPGTHPVYLPIEAENFESVIDGRPTDKYYVPRVILEKPNWFVSYDRDYLSRGFGILTMTQGATASKTINVPVDGNYKLWVRYAPVGEAEDTRKEYTGSTFEVKAEQDGKTVATHQFGKTLEYDTRMARWESTPVTLKKGAAKLTLTQNVPTNSGEKIDMFVLTNDQNYIPDQRHYGMVWLRFKILEVKNPGPYRAELRTLLHVDPWYKYADLRSPDPKAKDPSYFLTTGVDTGWINGLEFLKGAGDATLTLTLRDTARKEPQWGKVQLEYARLPRDSAIYKTVATESTRSYGFAVLGPMGDLEKLDSWSDTLDAISKQHLDQANAQNWPKDNVPKNIIVSASTSIGQYSDTVVRNELSTLRRMGMNFSSSAYDAWGGRSQTDIATKELGFDKTLFIYHLNNFPPAYRLKNSVYGDEIWKKIQEEIDARVKALRDESGEDEIKYTNWVALNDEVEGWLSPGGILAQPESLAAFKKWLDEQKITPASLGVKSWDELRILINRDEATTPEQKRLWMHEMDFQTATTTMVYKRVGQIMEKAFGHPLDTTLNPSPGGYMMRGWAEKDTGLNFIKFWQDGGVSLPWSEDWSYDNGLNWVTAETISYAAELARAGASQTRRTGMYITSGSADTRRQKMFVSLGRGAKHVNHYTYGPRFANTEGSWSHHPEIFNQIGFINADIAHADDLLGPAKQRKSQVALLVPWTSDVWQRNTAFAAERFYEYLALVHAQTPVDILGEEQIAAGGLNGYKVLYVLDDNVRKPAVQQIARWLNSGGTLVAMLNAGARDEYDADSSSFDTLLGLNKRTLQIADDGTKFSFHRQGVGQWTKVGEINFNGVLGSGKLPAYSMKTVGDVKGARVLGTWEDGSPAATINTSGQGRAIWIGAYPGLSYIRGANVGPGITNEYPADVRELVNAPVKLAGVKRDVELSTPIVEATLQESDRGAVVTLVNYTVKPIAELTMTARTSKPVKRAVAVQSGKELKYSSTADGVTMKLPLGMTEFVKLYY